jgi:hypothetical protein
MNHAIEELEALMSEVSERAFCAGWYVELEFRLWAILKGANRRLGQIDVSDNTIGRLADLSARTGGWIAYGKHQMFVPMDRWTMAFSRFERGETTGTIYAELELSCPAI